MDEATRIEAISLVERLSPEDLPALSAMAINAWCRSRGATHESVAALVRRVTQTEVDEETRDILSDMLSTYHAMIPASGSRLEQ